MTRTQATELRHDSIDVGAQVLERGVVRLGSGADHDVDRNPGWQELHPRQLAQTALELVAGNG